MEAIIYLLIIGLALIGLPLFVVIAFSLWLAFICDRSCCCTSKFMKFHTQCFSSSLYFCWVYDGESKSPQRMLRLPGFSWLATGGVAVVSLVVCAFTAFTGASGVTIIALGGLLYPILSKEGYQDKFTLGLITTSGSLGLLFPPSLPIILYGLVAKVDIDLLFKAGIAPGILVIAALSLYSILI